jgi:hypothetical protein
MPSRPQSNGNDQRPDKARHSRFHLSPAQSTALNAVARTLPSYRRNAFLLHVLASLKVVPYTVTDQQLQEAISNALAGCPA